MIKVLIVDDHPFTLMGAEDYLKDYQEIEVAGTATRGDEALEKIASLQPDVIVLDYNLPGKKGSKVAAEIKAQGWPVRVLAFSAYNELDIVQEMLNAGALGYLLKTDMVQELAFAIRSVAQGKKWFSQEIWELLAQGGMAQLQNGQEEEEEEEEEEGPLTVRQLEILQRVALGRTDAQIAVELQVTVKAVNKHLGRILGRLNAPNRTNAVYKATKKGWI